MVNLSSFIDFHARRSPDREAIVYGAARLSYSGFHRRIALMAGFLTAAGVGSGDIVAALMKNSTAFLEVAFAVSHLGAVFLPINFRLAGEEVDYILRHSGARTLIADEEYQTVDGLPPDTIWIDETAQSDSTVLTRGAAPAARAPRKPGDLFRLMYTSGTTDRPKGAMHTYDNFYWKCMDHITTLGLGPATRLLTAGPLYHVGAFDLPGIAVLQVGGMACLHRDFDPQQVVASIERERLTAAWFAPVMLSSVLSHLQQGSAHDVSSMAWITGGGERTPEPRIRAFTSCFPNGRYVDSYGLTETCSGDTMMEPGREIEKIGSVGRSLAHLEIEIRDEEGRKLPAGQDGEVCLRGPKVTQGYWRDAEKTKAAFFGDWFRTGDVGYLDDEGFLYLTDRKKDMIISGGENIASSEIERVIYLLEQVREAAVVGVPDDQWGERPVAVVALNPAGKLDYDALALHCRNHLAGYKVPKALVLRESLPRNPSGKILKRMLRDELAAAQTAASPSKPT